MLDKAMFIVFSGGVLWVMGFVIVVMLAVGLTSTLLNKFTE